MTNDRPWHEVLEVKETASIVVITAAYHALTTIHDPVIGHGDGSLLPALDKAFAEAREARR